jgi:hypothetical protein
MAKKAYIRGDHYTIIVGTVLEPFLLTEKNIPVLSNTNKYEKSLFTMCFWGVNVHCLRFSPAISCAFQEPMSESTSKASLGAGMNALVNPRKLLNHTLTFSRASTPPHTHWNCDEVMCVQQ